MNSSNSVAVRRFVDAFNRRDFDALVADAGPGTVLHEWPEAPGAQSYRGPEGMREAIEGWFESWESMEVEIESLEEEGDRVLAVFHQRARGRGSAVEVENRGFNVWSFEDGHVTEIHLFTEREPAIEIFRNEQPMRQEEKR